MPAQNPPEPVERSLRRRRFLASLAVAAAAVAVLAAAAAPVAMGDARPAAGAAIAATAVVRVGDGSQNTYTIASGLRVTVPVEVAGAAGLAAATVLLEYDPAVVQAVACQWPAAGGFDGGSCNVGFGPGSVKFNAVSLAGITGTHRLYDVVFQAVGSLGAATPLTPTVEHFADIQGNTLAVATAGGTITVTGQPGAVLRVGDAAGSVFTLAAGSSAAVSLTFTVSGTQRVGAATALLGYDPQVVRAVSCARLANDLDGGMCNAAFDPRLGLVKFNVLSTQGITGSLPLYSITFEAAPGAASGAASDLRLTVENLTDPGGAPVSWRVANGVISVAAGPANGTWLLVGAPAETGEYKVAHGSTVTASVWVSGAVDLGAATLALAYDRAKLRALGCSVDAGPGIDGGACALGEGRATAGMLSAGGFTGTARLFQVAFTPMAGAMPGATGPLSLTVENLATSHGGLLPSRVRGGSVQIAPGGSPVALVRVGTAADAGVFSLAQGAALTVPVRVEGAVGLGAASLSLDYDPTVLRPLKCAPAAAPFDGGMCNEAAGAGLVRAAVLSLAGFSGTAPLFELVMTPAAGAAVGSSSKLTLTVLSFDGTAGQPLLYAVSPGRVTITGTATAPRVVLTVGGDPSLIDVGQRITVPITVSVDPATAPLGLGAATLLMAYEPAVVAPVACRINLEPSDNGFDGGACNPAYAAGQVKLSGISMAGITGTARMAEITFRGQAPGYSDLTLSADHLADTRGDPLTYRVVTGSIGVTGSVGSAPAADLSLTMRAVLGRPLTPGDRVTYTLEFSNIGLLPAAPVRITDTLPAALQDRSYEASLAITTGAGPDFAWTLPELAPGAGGVITVYARIAPTVTATAYIACTAYVGADHDGNPANNQSTVGIGMTPAFLPMLMGSPGLLPGAPSTRIGAAWPVWPGGAVP